MDKYLQIKAFPFNNNEFFDESPILSILSHFDHEKDEFLKVLIMKRSGILQCSLVFDDKYTSIFCEVLRSYNYIVDPDFTMHPDIHLESKTVLHRKVWLEVGTKNLSISQISNSINSPTINYMLSTGSDGVGFLIVLGHLHHNTSVNPLFSAQNALCEYYVVDPEAVDSLINADKYFSASIFTLGSEQEQLNLAMELSHVVSGWDYTVCPNTLELESIDFDSFLDDFESNSMIDRRLSKLLTTVTKDELDTLLFVYDLVAQNDSLTRNLNSLWDLDVSRYFEKVGKSICLGTSICGEYEYHLAWHKLRQGLLIVGSSGSGKGNQLFRIIEQLNKDEVPMLIFESAKQEMHHLLKNKDGEDVVSNLKTWRPTAGEFLFNPFEIPEGLTLTEYRASLVQMLRTCFRLDGPLEELFVSTLNRCFYKYQYTDSSNSSESTVQKWGLYEFIVEYSRMIKESGYSPKTKDDMRQAGLTRLRALLDSNPDVYDTNRSIQLVDLIQEKCCNLIQLNSLPTIDAKQSLATMILIALGAYMQLRFQHCGDQEKLRLVIIMDESHNLLKSVSDINGITYSFADDFANLMLTLRSVGVGFIISDQTTANIPKVITDACDSKMFMGSSKFSGIADYLDFLGADDNLLRNLYRLTKGTGVFSFSGSPHCVVFQTDNYIDEFALAEDVAICNDFMQLPEWQKAATFFECRYCPYWRDDSKCNLKSKQIARQVSSQFVFKEGNPLRWNYYNKQKEKVDFQKESHNRKLYLIVKELNKRMSCDNDYCAFIQWLRICNLHRKTYGLCLSIYLKGVKKMVDDHEFDDMSKEKGAYDDTISESEELSDMDEVEPTEATEAIFNAGSEDFSDLDDAEDTEVTENEIDPSHEDFSDLNDAELTDVIEEEDEEFKLPPSLPIPNGRDYYDPRKRSDASLQRDVESGKIDAFERSDVGGHYTFKKLSDGRTLIKDVEPADNPKGHQQTDFIVKDGRIISIGSHNDE